MLAKLVFARRWLATALSFALFGLGGIIIPVMVLPLLFCLPGGKKNREVNAQQAIHFSFGKFIQLMRFMGVLTYEVHNLEELKSAQLVLANHPTLLDVVFLIALMPNANCVVKGTLLRNPFMRWPIKAAGYIFNNGNIDEVIAGVRHAFDKGQAMIVFPEGTRTIPSERLRLKRGAANIAILAGVDITPVVIICEPASLTKQDKWYHIPDKPMHFEITVKPKILVNRFIDNIDRTKGSRALTQQLTTYFNTEVKVNGSVT